MRIPERDLRSPASRDGWTRSRSAVIRIDCLTSLASAESLAEERSEEAAMKDQVNARLARGVLRAARRHLGPKRIRVRRTADGSVARCRRARPPRSGGPEEHAPTRLPVPPPS